MTAVKLEQRQASLALANQARLAISELRSGITRGEIPIAAALFDPRAASIDIGRLLVAQRGWGPTRARRVLRELEIRETRKVRELTTRQRVVLIEAIAGRA